MVLGSKNVAKDSFVSHPNDSACFKIYSVKIEHYFKGIVISNNHFPTRENVFHKSEGLPMKLSMESFFVLAIECKHRVLHEFKIPIEPTIQWKIVNGVRDGTFKHGHGADTKYLENDNNDCVIYYFPKDGIEKYSNVKEIPILIKINPKRKGEHKDSETNDSGDINNIGVCDYEHEFLLTLSLKQKEGLLNKMLYEISSTIKEVTRDGGLGNLFNPTDGADEKNSGPGFVYRYQVKDNRKTYSVFRKSVPSCKYCNVSLSFMEEHESSPITHQPKIDINTNRFFTSEYIKVSNNHHRIKNISEIKGHSTLFEIKSNCNGVYRFIITNPPTIKTSQTYWASTAGSFPCGNSEDCVIYHSPLEKELSKSPVTLSLFGKKIFVDSVDDEKATHLIDQKKIWLLRRITMGG
jgi:hypothetical protein